MAMKKIVMAACCWCLGSVVNAQELFAFTEPASNMAKGNIGLRMNNYIMKEKEAKGYNYHLIPEVMIGLSKKWMVHLDAFLSNRNQKSLETEGGSIYTKYRFFSKDGIQKHFRIAAYGRYSFNNSDIHQQEIETYGHNTGYELGLITTQLLHKLALSASASYEKALDNGNGNKFPFADRSSAINYTVSAGKLVLPKKYTTYGQTNLNLMLELLGQTNAGNGVSYLDVAPSLQLIFNSKARLDIGYRKQLYGSMLRTAPNGFMLRLE